MLCKFEEEEGILRGGLSAGGFDGSISFDTTKVRLANRREIFHRIGLQEWSRRESSVQHPPSTLRQQLKMGILPQLLPLVKPLTFLIGPAPLFYLYRSWRSTPAVKQCRRPLPSVSLFAIAILILSSLVYGGISLFGGSENIFYLTKARFITSPSILQNSLAKIRPLIQTDNTLIARLGTSLSERLNYARYGPTPLMHCSWCLANYDNNTVLGDATMYLLFSLPQIISPYLLHAFILGVTTTPFLTSSRTCRKLRTYIAYVIGLVLAAELWILVTADGNVNSSAQDLSDVKWLHWDLHTFRYTSLSILSLLQAVAVYIIETGLVVIPQSSLEDRVFEVGTMGEGIARRIKLMRSVKEVVMQSPEWRARAEEWASQNRIPEGDVSEETRRRLEAEARKWVDGMLTIGVRRQFNQN
jgi:hypothetical protein